MSELIKAKKQKGISKLPYLVLTITLLSTLGASFLFYQNAKTRDSVRFQNEVAATRAAIENRLNIYIALLKAGRGFIESDREIDQREFGSFVENLELGKNYSSAQAIGFTKTVRGAVERSNLIEQMRAGGHPDFRVFPDAEKDEAQIVVYIAPFDEINRKAFGFDMSSSPERNAAMQRAKLSGAPAATGRIFLVQMPEGGEEQSGFLIYLPVRRNAEASDAKEPGGFIYGAFRAKTFLDEIAGISGKRELSATIYDTEKQAENILASSGGGGKYSFETAEEFNVAGRKWIVEFRSLPEFEAQSRLGWMPLILTIGLVFSLLLFGATYLESRARHKSENIADDLRASEREKAFLLEREQTARHTAEQANRAKDQFISIVSHELRTPLNSIAGWSRILQAENITAPTRKQALQKIDKSLRIQTAIIEDLLDFSSMIADGRELNRQRIVFSDVFEECCAEIAAAADEKGVLLIKKNLLNGEEILGDREKMIKVLRNLLSNAVKFTPKGGRVFAAADSNGERIELRVTDNGKGIKSEFLPHIFDRFSQADSSLTRQFGGLGIGLTVTQHIIEMHGGTIVAESEGEDKGSSFTVSLPLLKN